MGVTRKAISVVGTLTRTNTVIPAPTGIVNGNLLVLLHYVELALSTPPAGFVPFTGLGPLAFPVHTTTTFWAWKKIASGESGSYTITHANASAGAVLLVYTGQAATVEDVAPSTNSGNANTNMTANGVTVLTPGSRLLYVGAMFNVPSSGSFVGEPPGVTPTFEPFDPFVNPLSYTDQWGLVASDGEVAAIATGNKTLALGPNLDDWVTTLITIRAQAIASGGAILPIKEELG